MAGHEAFGSELDFKDRKVRLVVFGILHIIAGGFLALLALLMIFGLTMLGTVDNSTGEKISFRTVTPGFLLYTFLSVWFICVGIGSVKTRRWARSLILVSSWLWLTAGVTGVLFMLLFIPNLYAQMEQSGTLPKPAVIGAEIMILVFAVIGYMVIPGLIVLFYSGRDVKATCESRDLQTRWTDECPLPILGASFACAGWAFAMLYIVMRGYAVPFFGTLVNNKEGTLIVLVLAAVLVYAAWGIYNGSKKAWWAALATLVCWYFSWIITYSNENMQALYGKGYFPAQQVEMAMQYGVVTGRALKWFFVAWTAMILGYFVYIRRYISQ